MTLTIGIDDAGRGPIIGPMILSGVLVDENSIKILSQYDIKDSKKVAHANRITLSKIIEQSVLNYKTISTFPEEIDSALSSDKLNLNTLEAMKMADVINYLNNKEEEIIVIIDCPSINTESFKLTLLRYIENPKNLDIRCEHKADENHIMVSAASILAKVRREEEVSKIKEKYGNIGSGYPSDPNTKIFLKENGLKVSNSGIIRKSWKTWENLFPQEAVKNNKGQTSLTKFS